MILGLYAFLLGIGITLIFFGILKHEYSGFALIGFGITFILAMILQTGNLEIQKGANSSTSFNYSSSGDINNLQQNIQFSYQPWNDTSSHQIGFWMAIASAIGFIFLIFSIQRGKKNDDE